MTKIIMSDNFVITLANLHLATEQQVFDQVARHLLKQGRKSVNTSDDCVYRGKDGLKCAAGILIADNEYSGDFENKSWGKLVAEGVVPSKHSDLIWKLQTIHDQLNITIELCQLPEMLEELAKHYKLSPAVLSEFQ